MIQIKEHFTYLINLYLCLKFKDMICFVVEVAMLSFLK